MLLMITGCSGKSIKLEDKWKPLVKLVESDLPFVSDTATTTIGDTIYTADLDKWLSIYPINSARFDALLAHEQVHSQRQFKYGVSAWITRYLIDKEFAWQEEKMGWEQEIRISRMHGIAKSDEMYAAILSTKYRGMVSYQEALSWIRSIR